MDQDLLGGLLLVGSSSGRSTSLPLWNCAGADERDQVRALTARQRDWAASISLNAMAIPAAREPGPLVILLRLRTVAKVDSIGFVVLKCTQCPAG